MNIETAKPKLTVDTEFLTTSQTTMIGMALGVKKLYPKNIAENNKLSKPEIPYVKILGRKYYKLETINNILSEIDINIPVETIQKLEYALAFNQDFSYSLKCNLDRDKNGAPCITDESIVLTTKEAAYFLEGMGIKGLSKTTLERNRKEVSAPVLKQSGNNKVTGRAWIEDQIRSGKINIEDVLSSTLPDKRRWQKISPRHIIVNKTPLYPASEINRCSREHYEQLSNPNRYLSKSKYGPTTKGDVDRTFENFYKKYHK